MRYLNIIKGTSADGPGLRNSLYVAGCAHGCPGCHNPESWKFEAGVEDTVENIATQLIDPYADVTISGGDPMYQPNELLELLKIIKAAGKNVWVFTGFYINELSEKQQRCLQYIDVLVDGPYDENKRDLTRFCGSTNQNIIYLKNGEITQIK